MYCLNISEISSNNIDDDYEEGSVANLEVPESRNFKKAIDSSEENEFSYAHYESSDGDNPNEYPENSYEGSDSEYHHSFTSGRPKKRNRYSRSLHSINSESRANETIQEDEDENDNSDEELKEGRQPSNRGTNASYTSKGDSTDRKKKNKSKSKDTANDKKNIEKRSGTFYDFGCDIPPDISKSWMVQCKCKVPDEESDEDDVYPLSIKYDRKKVWKTNLYKYCFLIFIIIILIPSNFYTNNAGKNLSVRTGFYADRIFDASLSMSGVNEFAIKTKNCIVYLLENTSSSSQVDVYVSASRSTSVSYPLESSVQTISVQSDAGTVKCYVEIHIPGAVTIPKLSFTYDGDSNKNILLYDYKDSSSWSKPMVITTMQFTISNSYPTVYFQNAHTVTTLTVSGTYCICSFSTLKIGTMTATISVGSLNIKQNSAYTQNSVTVKTPHGTHCVAGATVNTVDSGCPTTATRNSGYTGTYVDTSSYCQSTLYVCSNSAASCPASGTAVSSGQGSFTITLDDGPVQFLIDGSTTTASLTYTPTFDQFAITSQILLTENKNDFSSYPNDARVYIYPTVSPGYSRMWVHSSLKQYIQARPWLLAFLSLGVLQPSYYRDTLIHIPGSSCPYLTPNSDKQNTLISMKLYSSVYFDSTHLISQAANNTYYSYDFTEKGEYIQSQIDAVVSNTFILMSVIVSALISLLTIFAIVFFLVRFKGLLEEQYFKFLEGNRKFSRAKKEIEGKASSSSKLNIEHRKSKKVKILHLGLFTSRVIKKRVDTDNNEGAISKNLRKKKKATVSLFKVPELYIESIRRSRSNSFELFIESIYESTTHFPEWKLAADKYFTTISTRLDLVKMKYLEYCTKEGLKPKEIEREENILKENNLMIDLRSDHSTDAYSNIRWKTESEKQNDLENAKAEIENESEVPNSVNCFLKSECAKSTFYSDFILLHDLKSRYNKFCRENKIPELLKTNIVGSFEMEEFGAKFNPLFCIPYVRGLVLVRISGLKKSRYTEGIVRIPKDLEAKSKQVGTIARMKNRTIYFLFSQEGVVTNCLIVLIHVIIILGIPYCYLLAITWCLLQIGIINQDIYAQVYTLDDVFNPSSYDFWFNSLNGQVIFLVLFALTGWFFFTGLIELICHYATGARDTGKLVVTRTCPRWVTTSTFYLSMTVFTVLYTAYLSLILVWSILGAILNPAKFLPTAAGSAVFITFCVFIFAKLRQIEKTLKDVVSRCVDSSISTSLSETYEKEKEKLANLIARPVELATKRLFNQAINSFMKLNNLPNVDKDITDGILEGDAGAIAMLLHKSCGVDKNISLGLVGMLLQDNLVVLNSIYEISEEHGLDGDFNVTIAEIAFNEYNPDTQGINQVQSTVILSIKRLISKVFPQFPNDTIDGILQVALEADPRPMERMAEKLKIPPSVFKIIIGVATEDNKLIKSSLETITKEFLPPHYLHLFNAIYCILKGDAKGTLHSLAKFLRIKNVFVLEMIIAVLRKDTDFVRYSINEFPPQLCELAVNSGVKINEDKTVHLKNFFLGMQLLMKGPELQITNLIKSSLHDVDPYPAHILYMSSNGDLEYLEISCENLGFWTQKILILEFLAALTNQSKTMKELGTKLGVYEEDIEIFEALFSFVITSTKYNLQIKPKIMAEIKDDKDKKKEMKILYKEVLDPIRVSLLKSLLVLIRSGAVDERKRGLKKRIAAVKNLVNVVVQNFGGDQDAQDPLANENVNDELSKEEIYKICIERVEEIIDGKKRTENRIICSTVKYLQFDIVKLTVFKSMCLTASAYLTDLTMTEINENKTLLEAFKITCMILEIGEEYLELFLDIISQSPFRIFKCSTPNPKINPKTFEILAEFDSSRLELLADMTGYSRKDLRLIIAVWMDSYRLISNNKHVFDTLEIIKTELKIDPNILILMFKNNFTANNEVAKRELKYAIEAFAMKSFYTLKKNIENDVSASYFEELSTENFYEDRNKEISKLKDIESANELVDSPFAQINGRTSKDVVDFIVLLESMLKILDGDVETLKQLFGDGPGIIILSLVNKCIADENIELYLILLEKISTAIVIETSSVTKVSKYACKLEDWQSKKIENLSNSFSDQERSQWLILQLSFLFCCNRFNNMLLQVPSTDKKRINRALDDFFEACINKFLPVEQKLMPSQIGMKEIIISMFESSFFTDIAKQIFYEAVPQTQAISSPETILGIIVGLSLVNSNLVRTSLLHLLGETQNRVVSGLFGILAKDPNLEKDIKAISKSLKIKADLALNLVDLMCNEEDRDKYNPLMSICGNYCSTSEIVSAIVAIFKGDLSCVRILSERFEVDQHMLSIVLACASKKYNLLKSSFGELSKKLRINNDSAVEIILEIACGNEDKIMSLEDKKKFQINDKWLACNTLKLDKIGRKMRRPHSRFEIPDCSYSCRILLNKLEEVLGLRHSILDQEEGKEAKENELREHITKIIHAVWGSTEAIEFIIQHIDNKIAKSKGLISDIWSRYPKFKHSILSRSFKKLFSTASESISKINTKLDSKLKEFHELMEALNNNKYVKLVASNNKEASIIKSLKDYSKQLAFKIGCTVNIAGEKEFCQKYMECQTCERSTNIVVKVCLCCADFCHAGHELSPPKSPDLKMICSCGSHRFPHCPVNDKGNPLEKINEYGQLPPASCSILKSNNKRKSNGKNSFELDERLQNEQEEDEQENEDEVEEEQDPDQESEPESEPESESESDPEPEPKSIERSKHSSKEYKIDSDDDLSLAEESEDEDKMSTSQFQQENEGGEDDQKVDENEHKEIEENKNAEEPTAEYETIYYDDAELKEKFEEELANYKSEDFIIDLVLSLRFNSSQAKNQCPILHKNKFYIYDDSLCRYVHIFEHMILLAHGYCRPGLINLLTTNGYFDQMNQNNEKEQNFSYSSLTCLVSLMQGDFEYFLKYCKPFLKALDIKEGSGSSFIQKGARLLMLCQGFTHYTEIGDISGVKEEYERMFKELFPKKYKTIMLLHKLATLNGDRLISIFTCKNLISQSFKIKRDKELYTRLVEGLLLKGLELDNSSVEWVGSLTRICMGDQSGLDYICKAYDISSSRVNIYKAICSFDIASVLPLFEAIKEEIPINLCKSIFGVLNGNPEAVCDIVIDKINDNMYNNGIFEDLTEPKIILVRIITNLFYLAESNFISKDILTKVINETKIDESVINLIIGFNAIINGDEYNAHIMLESKQLKEEIGHPEVVDAIQELTIKGSASSIDKLIILFDSICSSYNLFMEKDRQAEFERWSKSVEIAVVKCLLNALKGDMASFGFIADNIYSENKSAICTLFGILSQGRYATPDFIVNDKNVELYKLKIIREVMRFYEKMFTYCLDQREIVDIIYRYEIHILLFLCLSQDFEMMMYFLDFTRQFNFLDQELLFTLYNLCSSKDFIPDLTIFFKSAKEVIEKKYKTKIEEAGAFPLFVKNFKIPNIAALDKAKELFEPLMEFDENSIIPEAKLKKLEQEYNYSILEHGIRLNAPSAFNVVFRALKNDTEAIGEVVTLVAPLLREIPGGIVIYNIISNLTKNDISKVITIMPNLVRIMLLTKFDLDLNLTDQEIEEKIKQLKFTESLIEGAVAWISSLIILINKNTTQFTLDYYKKIFMNMMTTLEKYENEIDPEIRIVKNAMKQANFILMILGLCRGNFEMIEILASEMGCFDGKVKELFSVFLKYKEIIFRNGIVGLPPLKQKIIEAQLKQGLNLAADQAKKALQSAIKEGTSMITDLAKNGATKMTKAARAQMEKLSKLVPGADKIEEATMIFADMFQRFDADNSGFIDYNEFCELCRYMGLLMDKEKTLRLFSAADRDHDNRLELREFQIAMILLKLEIATETLKKLGLTTEDLIWFAVFGIIYLLLLFIFIFLGIAAFSKAEGFNSVVNSIMPMAAGIASGARSIDLKAAIEKVKLFVGDVLKKIQGN